MDQYLGTLRGFSRNGKIVLGYTFVKGLTIALQGLIYNLFLLSLHFSSTFIGVLDAMSPLMTLLLGVPLGLLADRFGRKTLLVVCALINPLTFLGMAFLTSPSWEVVFGLANGIFASFYWIAFPAIIVESSTEQDRQHLFSVNSMLLLGMGALGYLLGGAVTVVAGQIAHQSPDATTSLRWGLVAICVVGVAGAIPLFWLHEPSRALRRARPRHRYDLRLFARLLLPDALLSFGAGAVLAFNQLYFVVSFGLSAGSVGLLLAVAGLIGSLGALVSPLLTRRFGSARAAIVLQGVSVPLIVALAVAPGVLVALAVYICWSLVRSAIDPTYTGFTMQQVPDSQRSTLSGLYSVTWAVGFGTGPIATGWLHGVTAGFTAPFLLAAASLAVASLALYTFFGRGGAATATAPEPARPSAAR